VSESVRELISPRTDKREKWLGYKGLRPNKLSFSLNLNEWGK